jgi:hypothetical protein
MPNIHHEILIGSPVEAVYNALTSQEGLSGWWTPNSSAKHELNSIARFPFGPDYFKEMKILQLSHAEQVKWLCVAGTGEWIGTTLSFKLYAVDKDALLQSHSEIIGQLQQQRNFTNGALLVFHHDDWKEYTPMFAECNYTWGQFLRSLKLWCETGKGRPWPTQHSLEQ